MRQHELSDKRPADTQTVLQTFPPKARTDFFFRHLTSGSPSVPLVPDSRASLALVQGLKERLQGKFVLGVLRRVFRFASFPGLQAWSLPWRSLRTPQSTYRAQVALAACCSKQRARAGLRESWTSDHTGVKAHG